MEKTLKLLNDTGLHARPAGMFVKKASEFKSEIFIKSGEKEINAKSIMGIMSLGLSKGTEFVLKANGPDEEDAVKALTELVESKFGEN